MSLLTGIAERWGRRRRGARVEVEDHDIGARIVMRELPGRPEQAALARKLLRKELGMEHPCLTDAELLTTEALTNGIRHSRSGEPGGALRLKLIHSPAAVLVGVRDDGGPGVPVIAQPAPDRPGGRGVGLLDRVSGDWGYHRDGGRNELWFRLGDRRTLA